MPPLLTQTLKLKLLILSLVVGAYRHNQFVDGALSCPTQKLFEVINPPKREDMNRRNFDDSRTIIGFKTITFHKNPDREKAVQFLKNTFPCARIILNIRSDTNGQLKSAKKYFRDVKSTIGGVRNATSHIKDIAKMLGDKRARLLDMSSWTKEGTGLQDLNDVVHWLGFRNCEFNSLYHEHKKGFRVDKTTDVTLGPNCHYPDTP